MVGDLQAVQVDLGERLAQQAFPLSLASADGEDAGLEIPLCQLDQVHEEEVVTAAIQGHGWTGESLLTVQHEVVGSQLLRLKLDLLD